MFKYILLALVIVFAGCSQKPVMTPKLKKAQNNFIKAQKDENINLDAQTDLLKASAIYKATKNLKSKEQADHYAYMLDGQLQLAYESVINTKLRKHIRDLKDSKTKALLDQKEREISQMRQERQNAREEARLAREAEMLSRQKLLELQELNAQQTNRGLVLTLGDVLFETGKSNLLEGSIRAIEKLSEFLIDNPQRQVIIEGHTDNVGSPTYNLDLSLRRSTAVKEALVTKEVQEVILHIKGYGEAYPVASNGDVGGRQRNRRVEIVILEEGATPQEMSRENQD